MRSDVERAELAKYSKLIQIYIDREVETEVQPKRSKHLSERIGPQEFDILGQRVREISKRISDKWAFKNANKTGDVDSNSDQVRFNPNWKREREPDDFVNTIVDSFQVDFYSFSENWTHEVQVPLESEEKLYFTFSALYEALKILSLPNNGVLTNEMREKIMVFNESLRVKYPVDIGPWEGIQPEEQKTESKERSATHIDIRGLTQELIKRVRDSNKVLDNRPLYIPVLEKVISRRVSAINNFNDTVFTMKDALEATICSHIIYELIESPAKVSNILAEKFNFDFDPMKLLAGIRRNILDGKIAMSCYSPERDFFKALNDGNDENQLSEGFVTRSYHGMPLQYGNEFDAGRLGQPESKEIASNEAKEKALLERKNWAIKYAKHHTRGIHFNDDLKLELAGDNWLRSLYPKILSDFMYDSTKSEVQINDELIEDAVLLKLPKDMDGEEWIAIFNQMMRACNKTSLKPILRKQSAKIYSATLIKKVGALLCRQLVEEHKITKKEAIYRATLILNLFGFKVQRATVKKNSVDLGSDIKLAVKARQLKLGL